MERANQGAFDGLLSRYPTQVDSFLLSQVPLFARPASLEPTLNPVRVLYHAQMFRFVGFYSILSIKFRENQLMRAPQIEKNVYSV